MQYSLNLDRVLEIRMEYLILLEGLQEISQSKNERVLIPQNMSGRPEIRDVRMAGAGNQNVVTTLGRDGISSVKHVEAIKVLQIEADSALCAVDFKIVPIAAADCKTSGLEGADAAIRKTRQH